MKRLIIGVAIASFFVGLSLPAHADVRRARLDSFQENPDVFTVAKGDFTAIIARDNSKIDFELNYQNLEGGNPTVAHIHLGKPGVNGGIMAFLCGGGGQAACPASPSGTITGTILPANVQSISAQGTTAGILDELIFALRKRHAYVNVHNATFQNGEIRGQVR
jgi:CHRD domain